MPMSTYCEKKINSKTKEKMLQKQKEKYETVFRVDGIHVKSPSAPHLHSSAALPHECSMFVSYKKREKKVKNQIKKKKLSEWRERG